MEEPRIQDLITDLTDTLSQLRQMGGQGCPVLNVLGRSVKLVRSDLVKNRRIGIMDAPLLTRRGRSVIAHLLSVLMKTKTFDIVGEIIKLMLGHPVPSDAKHLLDMLLNHDTSMLVFNHPCTWNPSKVDMSFSGIRNRYHASPAAAFNIRLAAENVPVQCFFNNNINWGEVVWDGLLEQARMLDFQGTLYSDEEKKKGRRNQGGLEAFHYILRIFAHFVENQEFHLKSKVDSEFIYDFVRLLFPGFIPVFFEEVLRTGIPEGHVDALVY